VHFSGPARSHGAVHQHLLTKCGSFCRPESLVRKVQLADAWARCALVLVLPIRWVGVPASACAESASRTRLRSNLAGEPRRFTQAIKAVRPRFSAPPVLALARERGVFERGREELRWQGSPCALSTGVLQLAALVKPYGELTLCTCRARQYVARVPCETQRPSGHTPCDVYKRLCTVSE